MFSTHYLDDPKTGDTLTLDGFSYLAAALLGPLYVLLKGFALPALAMTGLSLAIVIVTAGLIFVFTVSWDTEGTVLAGVVLIALALMTQGQIGVEIVRRGFLKRGYREGYY